MTYHEFLAYLFDRPPTRDLAVELAAVVARHRSQPQPTALAARHVVSEV
jgi:hypothetical protein